MANGVLIAHCGAKKTTREEIFKVPTPKPQGSRHKPIPHQELIETIDDVLHDAGFEIASEELALNKNKIFGILTLEGSRGEGEWAPAIGYRAGNDQSLAVRMVSGGNVFVCDNLMLLGDEEILKRRHTTGLNLREEVELAFSNIVSGLEQLEDLSFKLKEKDLTDNDARSFLWEFAVNGSLPYKLAKDIDKEYFEPRHEAFRDRNAWSLYNAVTEIAKRLRLRPRMDLLTELSRRMNNF